MIDYSPPLDAKSWKGVQLDDPARRVLYLGGALISTLHLIRKIGNSMDLI